MADGSAPARSLRVEFDGDLSKLEASIDAADAKLKGFTSRAVNDLGRVEDATDDLADSEARYAAAMDKATAARQRATSGTERANAEQRKAVEQAAAIRKQMDQAIGSLGAFAPATMRAAQAQAAAAAAHGRAATAANGAASANDNLGKKTEIANHHLNNLLAQITDIGVSLQAGQSPFTVLLQQGSQIAPVLGETGVMGAVRGVGQFIGRFITPATVTVGALAAAVIYGYGAWSRYDEETRKTRATLEGLGRGLGLTVAQFEDLSSAAAKAGNLSTRQASDIGRALAATGKIGPENIARLIPLAKEFGATFGLSLDEVRVKLASSFSSLDGIKRLNQELGFLDAKTQQYITDLYQQGRAQDAIRLAIERMPQALARQEDAQGFVARAWKSIKDLVSEADLAVGKFLDRFVKGPSAEDRIEGLKEQVRQARDELKNAEADATAAAAARSLREQKQAIKSPGVENLPGNTMVDNFRFPDDSGVKAKSAALTELEAKLDAAMKKEAEFRREQEKTAASNALEKSLIDKSNALQTLISTLQPGSDEFRTYKNYLDQINEAMKGGDTDLKKQLVDIREYTELQDRLTHAVDSNTNAEGRRMTEAEKAAEQRRNQIAGIRAETTEQRAQAAQNDAVARQRGQLITQEQALADAQHAAQMVREQDAQQLRAMLKDRQAEGAEIREQIRLVGADAETRAVAIARRRTEQEIVRDGKDLHSDAAQAVIREAEANARLGVVLDNTVEAQRRMQDAQRQLGDEVARFFDDIMIRGQKAGETFQRLAQSMASSGLRALLTGQGPLAAFMGTAGENGQLGGILGGKGGFLGIDLSDLRKTFKDGFGQGFDDTFGSWFQTKTNAAGQSQGFMSSPIGGALGAAGMGAAMGFGTQSPVMGATGGGMAGLDVANEDVQEELAA